MTFSTVRDIREYFLANWREILPEVLVPQARVSRAIEDGTLIQVQLRDQRGSIRRLLLVPVTSGEPRVIRGLLPRLRDLGARNDLWAGLLVPHMGSAGSRLCREAGLGFQDCCGNSFMRFNEVVVQISGNRNRFSSRKRVRTLFKDKATIPLRILLETPGEWLTTRQIAESGGLSLGWVSHILQQMNVEGYVERKRGGGTRLVKPERLVTDWLQEYTFELNDVFPFRIRSGDLDTAVQRLRVLEAPYADRYALTLNAGVHALRTGRSQRRLPFDLHMYLPDLSTDPEDTIDVWSDLLDLRPSGMGANCCLVKPAYRNAAFFKQQAGHGLRVVSDLQLYLDLYHYPGAGRQEACRSVLPRLPFSVE